MDFYTNVQTRSNEILYRGYKDGKKIQERIAWSPSLFVPSRDESKYASLEGKHLKKIVLKNISKYRDFLEQHKGVVNSKIYGDIRLEYAYITERFGPGDIKFDPIILDIAKIDIEVSSENGFPDPYSTPEEITAITVERNKKYITFGCGDFKATEENQKYVKCLTELDLLNKFLNYWSGNYPDIVTGWNIRFFDIPYLYNRTKKLLGSDIANALSPWGWVKDKKISFMNKEVTAYEIVGIGCLDYLELYRKFSSKGQSQESYALNNIAYVEVGEKKLDYSEHTSLQDLYKNNFQKFIEYNIKDVALIDALDNKLNLLNLALGLTYNSRVNFEDVFKQTRMWDSLIYNYLFKRNIIIPGVNEKANFDMYSGAYVKDPQVGFHKWIASFDLASMYPHLIMTYNLSPETLIDTKHYSEDMKSLVAADVSVDTLLAKKYDLSFLKKGEATFTPNKQFFSTGIPGFLGFMMQEMYEERLKTKTKMLDLKKNNGDKNEIASLNTKQEGLKVCLNSAYGSLGSPHFRFYDIRIAEAITLSGQLTIRWLIQDINKELNKWLGTEIRDYVIASDTDSLYIDMLKIVEKIPTLREDQPSNTPDRTIRAMEKICRDKIQPIIDSSLESLGTYLNVYKNKMSMKQDVLASSGIWTAKKRYVLRVHSKEGVIYKTPELLVHGLEIVKSSTPELARKKLKEAMEILLDQDRGKLVDFITTFEKEFQTLPIAAISFPRGISGMSKYWNKQSSMHIKGTPIHVKGAFAYNTFIKNNKLDKKHALINEADKIKFVYLKEPNPFQNNTMAFPQIVPEELKLEKYVDRATQFDKVFLDPLKIIVNVVGWKLEETSSLEGLF